MDEREPSDHPGPEFLAGYLDRRLEPADRERVAGHLARCRECRDALTDVSVVMRADRRRRRWISGASAAAAIAAALMVVVWTGRDPPVQPDVSVQRSAANARDLGVWIAQLPSGGSDGRLVWAMAAPGAQYRISITDRTGAELWSVSTSDTTALVPEMELGDSARPAFWVVDALLPDGRTRTTGLSPLPAAAP